MHKKWQRHTVVCSITAPYDFSAHLPGLSYWGQDFYIFFARMTIKPGLFTKLPPGWTFSWIFTKLIGTPDGYSAPCIYLFSAWMIIRHLTLSELLPVLLIGAVFYYRSELPALAEIDKGSGKKNDCILETKLRYFLWNLTLRNNFIFCNTKVFLKISQ